MPSSYKCPNCGAVDEYRWAGYDDLCTCLKCGKDFEATMEGVEIKNAE